MAVHDDHNRDYLDQMDHVHLKLNLVDLLAPQTQPSYHLYYDPTWQHRDTVHYAIHDQHAHLEEEKVKGHWHFKMG
jgi:hypothetical protein